MRDIKIDPYGDIDISYSGIVEEVGGADTLYQMLYIAIKTFIGTWQDAPNVGSTLSLHRGKILDSVVASMAIEDINEAIRRHPVLSNMQINVELISVVRDTIHARITMYDNVLENARDVIIDPYNSIFQHITPEEADEKILDTVRRKDYILNNAKFKKRGN